MLFATYQKIYDFGKKSPKNLLNPERYYNKKLGFSPLWAFPVDDISSFAAHSLCTAPNFADIFYLIETDKYVRINKVMHYQMISRGEYKGCEREDIDYSGVIDERADNDHSEFLLDPDHIRFEDLKCICPVADVREDAYQQLHFIAPPMITDDKALHDIAYVMRYFAKDIPVTNFEDMKSGLIEMGYTEQYAEIEGRQRIMKFAFEMLMFPYIYQCYVSPIRKMSSKYLGMISHNSRKLLTAVNDFARWSEGPCEKEGYDRIFNEIKNLVITDDAILECAIENRKIYPNEPCPCGSGKKFKVCHGRYY